MVDLLGGDTHAAAVSRLSSSGRTWRQVAVYEVAGGRIDRLTAFEDEREPG